MDKQKFEIIVISFLNNSSIKSLPILIYISIFGTKKVNVAIIGTDIYSITCKLKEAQVFAISIRDLEY